MVRGVEPLGPSGFGGSAFVGWLAPARWTSSEPSPSSLAGGRPLP